MTPTNQSTDTRQSPDATRRSSTPARVSLRSRMIGLPWAVIAILNLPVDRDEWKAARHATLSGRAATSHQLRTGPSPAGPQTNGHTISQSNGRSNGHSNGQDPASRNPYLEAAAQLQQDAVRPDSAPWQQPSMPVSRRRWYTILRTLLVVVLVLLVYLGVRAIVRPAIAPIVAAESLPAGLQYPEAAASGLAERFTAAYLSWNETSPDSRAAALRQAGWAGDPKIGWNGKGRQAVVGAVDTIAVTPTSDTAGSITTIAQVDVWPRTTSTGGTTTGASNAAQPTRRTVALKVPIGVGANQAGTGLGVSSAPALVAPPAPAGPVDISVPNADNDLSAETRPAAEAFFAAYAKETDLNAITAPGSQIAGLGGIVAYSRITAWQVAAPTDPDQTTAVAVVVWAGPDGSETAQTYHLTLRKVASGSTSRWQVFTIN